YHLAEHYFERLAGGLLIDCTKCLYQRQAGINERAQLTGKNNLILRLNTVKSTTKPTGSFFGQLNFDRNQAFFGNQLAGRPFILSLYLGLHILAGAWVTRCITVSQHCPTPSRNKLITIS